MMDDEVDTFFIESSKDTAVVGESHEITSKK
jgi:hypothetical protein